MHARFDAVLFSIAMQVLVPCGIVLAQQADGVPPSLTKQQPILEEVKTFKGNDGLETLFFAESVPHIDTVNAHLEDFIERQLRPTAEAPTMPQPLKVLPDKSAVQKLGNRWVANWKLTYAGIPLTERSNVTCNVVPNGSISLRQRNVPVSMEAALRVAKPVAVVSDENAVAVAKQELAKVAGEKKRELNVERLRPIQNGPEPLRIWVDPETKEGRLVREFTFTPNGETNAETAIRAWVTVGDKERVHVVGIQDLIHPEHKGRVRGPIWDPTPLDAAQQTAIPHVRLSRVDSEEEGSTGGAGEFVFTDDEGKFSITGAGPAKLQAVLRSNYFEIRNMAGTVQTLEETGDDQQDYDFVFADGNEFEIAQVSAFYWAHKVRRFVGATLSDSQLLNVPILVNSDGECNAFFNSGNNSLTLYRASPASSSLKCINRAYRDTIFHEYGHGVDHACNGILDDGYSEGFGDSLAILYKNQPCYGSNCCGGGTCLRDASAIVLWTDKAHDDDPHEQGRVYAGFTWELIQQLTKMPMPAEGALQMAKDLTLHACKANPTSIPNAVELVFEADDDDADLSNGSPHFKAIASAADSRKIPRPPDPMP